MLKRPKLPCPPNCKDRQPGCHGNCKAYISYRQQIDSYNEEVKSEKERSYITNGLRSHIK